MTEITRRYVCDRCGKDVLGGQFFDVCFKHGKKNCFATEYERGEVCEECHKDFIELAESFFDELNKGEQE